jgi:hypothetical protein
MRHKEKYISKTYFGKYRYIQYSGKWTDNDIIRTVIQVKKFFWFRLRDIRREGWDMRGDETITEYAAKLKLMAEEYIITYVNREKELRQAIMSDNGTTLAKILKY